MSGSIPQPVAIPAVPAADGDSLPRRRLVFAIVAIALFMASIDQTIVATALSTIQHDLHAGIEWSSWTITIYALGQLVVMPLAGKLSDMYGRKRIFVTAVVLFTVASLLCGLATNIYVLVALRALQAIGGGAFMPSATGIVADHFGRDRDRALGMFTSVFPIGGIVGPVLGGIFVIGWSWRGIFLVNVPIGVALIILAVVFLPKSRLRPSKKLDIPGVMLLAVVLLSAMLGITLLGGGSTSPLGIGFLLPEAIAIVALVLFLVRIRYAANPFISLRLLRGRAFGAINLINFLYGAAALGFGAMVPLYAQERFGIPVLQAGTLLTARAIGVIVVAGLAVFALRRTGYRIPMMAGYGLIAVGVFGMAVKPDGVSPYLWLSLSGAIAGIGMGLSMPATNNATMQLAPDELAGIAGLRGMFRQAGAIMGVSITTAVVAASANPGQAFANVFIIFAALLVCVVAPMVFLVPEHRGRW